MKGSILIGIVITTILGIITGQVHMPSTFYSLPPSIIPLAFKMDIIGTLKISLIVPIFSLMFVDLFDSLGSIIACANEAGFVDNDGNIPKIDKILKADAFATTIGAAIGTSSTTTFVESATGIAEGGRTGLTSIVVAFLFGISLFFSPLIQVVPKFATAPALIIVGIHMFKNLLDIELNKVEVAIPCFLTILLMPLTYSISTGIAFGIVSYVIISICTGKIKEIPITTWFISILSLISIVL
ncbi:solute carrier family 23 protein [Sebaldella sp. S0638]|uniref:solute carrier family 23 protein n=1 Tax=Sebaldella sp. S0638 TaxID=2957809 RepID=UPI00353256DF